MNVDEVVVNHLGHIFNEPIVNVPKKEKENEDESKEMEAEGASASNEKTSERNNWKKAHGSSAVKKLQVKKGPACEPQINMYDVLR